jgi:hypothetical protein
LASLWFRLYSEFADDPKVQVMTEAMQRRLVMLMCFRCKDATLQPAQLAFYLRISASELEETKALFIENGFIDDDWSLVNWNKRQFLSDSSTERSRRSRRRKQQSATLQDAREEDGHTGVQQSETLLQQGCDVAATAPEQNRTDTEAEQKQRQKENRAAAKKLAVAFAKETAAKSKALRLTSSEVPASIVLPAASGGDAGSEADGERAEGVNRGAGGREAAADHPSLFPHAEREQVPPASGNATGVVGADDDW